MSVLSVFDGSARALEIARVVTRYEWSFLSQLLNRGDAAETRLPQPQVLCQILIELGPVYVCAQRQPQGAQRGAGPLQPAGAGPRVD